ncbi:MAG: thioesterase family protein [Selenomonadaceae bacterium]|nr:thioesterase family protein [Selenomonadaceae bacterium]
MESTLKIGMSNSVEIQSTEETTALELKSGSLRVLATPAMMCLMEQAAAELVERNLSDDLTSVGIAINISHKAPTPIGLTVRAEAVITNVDGRKITFDVKAFDDVEEIGSGTHERFIVNKEKFQTKADGKLNIGK